MGEPSYRPSTGAARRAARAVVTGVLLAGAVLGLRAAGLLDGAPALAVFAVLVLAVPTSRSLSRRVLLAGCLCFGWAPVLWWFPPEVGSVGRVTAAAALGAGLLGAWVAHADVPRRRLRRLVPRLRPIDSLPVLAALGATVALSPRLTVRDGASALTLMFEGWDNVAHSNIVGMIRAHGSVLWMLPAAPDGSPWSYADYPQGFHAAAATVVELMSSPAVGTPTQEAARFLVATAVLTVAMVLVLAAGVCALPWLRHRPALALPAVSLVLGVVVLGPGASSVRSGFGNFLLACVLTAACWLVTLPMPRVAMPLHVAAAAGAVVGVANSWTPLLVLVVPAAAALALPLRRDRWSAPRTSWIVTGLTVGLSCAAALLPLLRLRSVDVGGLATLVGGIEPPPFEATVSLALLTIVACLVAARRRREPAYGVAGAGVATRAGSLALVPLLGLAAMSVLAAQDYAAGLPLNYYFWKLTTAVEIVSLLLLATTGATLAARARPARTGTAGRLAATTSSLLVSAVVLTACGHLDPAAPWGAPGAALVAHDRRLLESTPSQARELLSAVPVQSDHPGSPVVFVPIGWDLLCANVLAQQWYLSLSRTWTAAAAGEPRCRHQPQSAQDAAAEATGVLEKDPRAVVLVRPDDLSTVRSLVTRDALRARIITWP